MRKLLLIIILALIALPIYFRKSIAHVLGMESGAPTIAVNLGDHDGTPGYLTVDLADEGSGLSKVTLAITQGDKTIPLVEKQYDDKPKSDKLQAALIEKHELNEGSATVTVSASDAAFWSNHAESKSEILIDYSKPKVRVLSLQHVAAQAGAEFVIYEAADSNLTTHGVKVGETFFPGYQAGAADPALSTQPQMFVSLFALPFGYDRAKSPLTVVAKDAAGNETSVPLIFRIEPKEQKTAEIQLKDDFLAAKTSEMFSGYQRMAAESSEKSGDKPADIPLMVWQFRLINENYRALLDKKIKELTRASTQPRLWKDVFMKPMPSATSSTLGEQRTYKYNGADAGHSVHNGLDLASTAGDSVHSANDGVVALAKEFGIYGNAVMIDHGLGLFTLYGHLSSIGVKFGDKVTRGQEIGRTGQTGLAGGDHLHFEFRLREVPITPIEWWDPKWIHDNIDGKLAEIKSTLPAAAEPSAPQPK